jgi:hypothetical protein
MLSCSVTLVSPVSPVSPKVPPVIGMALMQGQEGGKGGGVLCEGCKYCQHITFFSDHTVPSRILVCPGVVHLSPTVTSLVSDCVNAS